MPTVPGILSDYRNRAETTPTPEQLLMTAADMHARGQLTDEPTFKTPGASLRIPFGGTKSARPSAKRR
jgi:hypothetical protein